MGHDHSHHDKGNSNIKVAFFLNLGFTILEIIGGFWTNSLAILSDAVHDLGDSISIGISWYLQKKSKGEKNEKYSYGYLRFSLLGALINCIILLAGSLYVISEAVQGIMKPEHTNAKGMLLFAVIGIAVNGIAVLRLKKGSSLNEKVLMWHLFEDVLGWVAVLIVSIVLLFKDIHVLDPILSILISLYVLYNVFRNLRKTLFVFLQGVPKTISIPEFEQKILQIPKVKSTHHTHIWSLDGEHHVLTTHVVIDNAANKEDSVQVKNEVRSIIDTKDIQHVTIEVEYENEECRMKES